MTDHIKQTFQLMDGDYAPRPVVLEDAEAIVELLNRHSTAVVGRSTHRLVDLRQTWQEPGFNLATDARLVMDAEGAPVGYIEYWNDRQPHVEIWSEGTVDPAHQRRKIGTYLQAWAEVRGQQELHKAPPDARVVIGAQSFHSDEATTALLVGRGYILTRHFLRMVADLTEAPPTPAWPDGITVRPLVRGQDERAAFDVYHESFKDHWGHVEGESEDEAFQRWLHQREIDPDFDPSLYFLATAGDAVAAVCFSRLKNNQDPNMGYVRVLGVQRTWRQRGLGRALLLHTFGELYRRGQRRVGLHVDAGSLTGATRLYESVGMVVDHHQWDYYQKELRPGIDLMQQTLDE